MGQAVAYAGPSRWRTTCACGTHTIISGGGTAYLFEQSPTGWVETAKLLASDGAQSDLLGRYAAAIAGDAALFGVPFADTTAGTNAGAVYAFDLPDVNSNQVPDACERNFTYDADGNMTGDEDFTYTWDGENRLVKVEPLAVSLGDHRVRYTYDYQGRRVERRLEEWEDFGRFTTWVAVEITRYVYDGWNVVLELDAFNSNAVNKKYTWGLDLSQSLQGAGGVGGLLACRDYVHSPSVSMYVAYLYQYDGNGNVTALVDSAPDSEGAYNGTVLARYDYDPYGNTLSAGGAEATNNPYRFSTKPVCDATGDYYYGYRFYSPGLGRWRSRDVIEEPGGMNLYGFVFGQPTFLFDILGRDPRRPVPTPKPAVPIDLKDGLKKVCERGCECSCACKAASSQPTTTKPAVSQPTSRENRDDCLRNCRKECDEEIKRIQDEIDTMKKGLEDRIKELGHNTTPFCMRVSERLAWQIAAAKLSHIECEHVKLGRPPKAPGGHQVVGCRPKACPEAFIDPKDPDNPNKRYKKYDMFIDLTNWNRNDSNVIQHCFAGGDEPIMGHGPAHDDKTYYPAGVPVPVQESCPAEYYFGPCTSK